MARDKANLTVAQSARIAKAAENGFGTGLHRSIRPLKQKKKSAKMLSRDMHGHSTSDKAQEGKAVKEYLAAKCRGRLVGYAELLNETRTRERTGGEYMVDANAVVGILDSSVQAAVCPAGKSY